MTSQKMFGIEQKKVILLLLFNSENFLFLPFIKNSKLTYYVGNICEQQKSTTVSNNLETRHWLTSFPTQINIIVTLQGKKHLQSETIPVMGQCVLCY